MNPASGPELRDIHLPPPPSWWPPAPGWWLLALLAVLVFATLLFAAYRKLQRRRRRAVLLAEFERSVATANGDAALLAAALSAFLRRLARRQTPAAATLSGESWLRHLDTHSADAEFTRGVGRHLLDAPYRPAVDYDRAALIALVRRYAREVADA